VGIEREREVLERAVHAIADHARDAYALIDQIHEAGHPTDSQTMLAAKKLRMQLLTTKGELERELARLVRDCRRCDRTVHWVPGVGSDPGRWAHAEPAPPDHEPAF
jgi:hypothetical protein